MNPLQTTPRQDPDVDETTGHDDPLDGLLAQIIDGFFVLTDGQGAISKWSEPAELLFGLEASEVRGKRLFNAVVDHAPPAAEAWKRFLESGESPDVAATQPVSAIHAPDGRRFPLEMVFIPVKLDEGFDFSLFLEDLSFELPRNRNRTLTRMRRQHTVVVRALAQSLGAEPQRWPGGRTAGTLVAFRPTQPTPWVDEALDAREAARAAADLEAEARLDPDPGIHGDSIFDLDDAAAVVARLLAAVERIDELERTAADVPAGLEAVRLEARSEATRAVEARFAQERRRTEPGAVEAAPDDALEVIRERAAFADAAVEAAGQHAAAANQAVQAAREEAAELREELATLHQRVEGLGSQLTSALATLAELKAGLAFREILGLAGRSGRGGNVTHQAELGKLRAELAGELAPIPTRLPRHGFDDVAQPLALLNLKGRFCELNPAFSKLVGYQEHEFLKAVWPSVHDRAVIAEQTDQLAAMVAGELQAVEIHSSYMHSQGLMVAVDGKLTLIRDAGGEPMSLLLTAKELGPVREGLGASDGPDRHNDVAARAASTPDTP